MTNLEELQSTITKKIDCANRAIDKIKVEIDTYYSIQSLVEILISKEKAEDSAKVVK